jgi:pyruvate-ferredoxin/flavodoxin oxidoreductase
VRPQDSKTATLRNMLMVRRNYDALVSGDGACAGCGEKSILRAIAAVTEAYMRPIFHAKADRLRDKAQILDTLGVERLTALKARSPEGVRSVPSAIRAPRDGPGRRERQGHESKNRRVRTDIRPPARRTP